MNTQRLIALTRKEVIQILRDRRFIMLFLGLAFVQLFVYGYSASKTVYHLPLAVAEGEDVRPGWRIAKIAPDRLEVAGPDGVLKPVLREGELP